MTLLTLLMMSVTNLKGSVAEEMRYQTPAARSNTIVSHHGESLL